MLNRFTLNSPQLPGIHQLRRASVMILFCLLTGCYSPPPTYYVQPPSLTPDFAATLDASGTRPGSAIPTQITITVQSIDGALTSGDQLRRVLVTPGLHTILFAATVTAPPHYMATGWLRAHVVLLPGTTYFLASSGIIPGQFPYPTHLDAWLMQANGQPASTTGKLFLLQTGPQVSSAAADSDDTPPPLFIPEYVPDFQHHQGSPPARGFNIPPLRLETPPPHFAPPPHG